MLGFNGQVPGPLIDVRRGSRIVVNFRNEFDQPTAVHWHGIRLQNRFDGVPHVTQDPVAPGSSFVYEVVFPDEGVYWYHPHHREDIQQEAGLYGNMLVAPDRNDAYAPVNSVETIMLDDLLLGETGMLPFGLSTPVAALMGRFGNVFLINGEERWHGAARKGDVVRFHLTNVANTRPFNVSFPGARMKLVGVDIGRLEREEWVENVMLAPAERVTVDVRFDSAGSIPLQHRYRALNHATGALTDLTDTLGIVTVAASPTTRDYRGNFETLRANPDVSAEILPMRMAFTRIPDRTISLRVNAAGLSPAMRDMMSGTPVPIDWNDGMPSMNYATTGNQVRWIVRDSASGAENMDITTWKFQQGDLIRLRIFNDPAVFHAMAHPIHLHGQRALVLSRNGVPTRNFGFKDTVLVQAGETVELLVEMSNPGKWMLHCHIAEHLSAGMMMLFEVSPAQ